MKYFDLNNMGVCEMTYSECIDINGGEDGRALYLFGKLVGIIVGGVVTFFENAAEGIVTNNQNAPYSDK